MDHIHQQGISTANCAYAEYGKGELTGRGGGGGEAVSKKDKIIEAREVYIATLTMEKDEFAQEDRNINTLLFFLPHRPNLKFMFTLVVLNNSQQRFSCLN